MLNVPCDKDDLYDDIYVILIQPLMNGHAIYVLKSNVCLKTRHNIHNVNDVDKLKLLSSLNNLVYMEFDVICNNIYLEEKLYAYIDLPWLSKYTYHVCGKYDNKGQFMIQPIIQI